MNGCWVANQVRAIATASSARLTAAFENGSGDRFTLADILLFSFVDFGGQVGQPLDAKNAKLKSGGSPRSTSESG